MDMSASELRAQPGISSKTISVRCKDLVCKSLHVEVRDGSMARPGIWICLCVLAASAASAQMRQVDTSCTIMLLFQSRLSMTHVAASAPWYRCALACARTLGLHSTAGTWRCEICCVAHSRPTRSMALQIGRLHVAYSAVSHQSVRHVVSMTSQHAVN